jgi:hypothetical protein
LLATSGGRGQDGQLTEYQLKAAFLYHFAQLVDWPARAFAGPNSPMVIGVLGQNPFGHHLEATIRGKSVNGHPLEIKEFQTLAEVTNGCHVLFIGTSEKKQLPEIVAALRGTSVLLVGEMDRFIEGGGMINFVLDGAKIRFQINDAAAQRAGLKMSSKLLSLASNKT